MVPNQVETGTLSSLINKHTQAICTIYIKNMSFILHFPGSRHRFVRCSCELTRRKRFALRRTGFLGRDEEKLFSLTYLLSYLLNYLVTCLITFLST